jgi:hypothetical protein
MMAAQKQEAPGALARAEGRIKNTLSINSTANPFDRLLDRLEGVQHHGKGCRAICPACGGKSRKLSLTQADDGRVLLHCFAGCSPHDVLAAVGLTVNDLFVRRIESSMTPAQKRELREYAKQSQWRAALDALQLEIGVVHIAARQVSAGQSLAPDDLLRVGIACDRIRDARSVLNERY